jgi:hypothetical protein
MLIQLLAQLGTIICFITEHAFCCRLNSTDQTLSRLDNRALRLRSTGSRSGAL